MFRAISWDSFLIFLFLVLGVYNVCLLLAWYGLRQRVMGGVANADYPAGQLEGNVWIQAEP